MTQVDIYYCRVCGLCTRAIDFFRERGVSFRALAVEWNAEADAFTDSATTREMYRRCGGQVEIVPQIFIGDRHVPGWRQLEPMIASGDLDRILPPSA